MNEPRKPIFGFLWPRPDPNAPVDGDYRQVRRVRVSPRGPIRLAGLVALAVATVIGTGSAVMAAAATTLSPLTVLGGAAAATAIFLLLRGWVVGTYVNDAALVIQTTFRTTVLPWTDVRAVTTADQPCPFLGLPIRVRSVRLSAVDTSGRVHPTGVYASSPDFWLRPEAFDMARLRLERWRQDFSAS